MTWTPEPNNRFGPDDGGRHGPDRDGAAGDWADALARLSSDARTDERVTERRRRRWLERQAAESSTFVGLLANLAEAGTTVRLLTVAGGSARGVPTAVGADVVVLRDPAGHPVLVALDHVTAIEEAGPTPVTADRAGPGPGPSLRHLLADLADEQTEVTIGVVDTSTMTGRLLWVGTDVLALGPTGPAAAIERARLGPYRYVRLSSLIVVSPSASG